MHTYTRNLNPGTLPAWACEGCGLDQPDHDKRQRLEAPRYDICTCGEQRQHPLHDLAVTLEKDWHAFA